MDTPDTIQLPRKRYFIYGSICLFIGFPVILSNLLYIRSHLFQKNGVIYFSISSSLLSTAYTSITKSTKSISTTSRTDINELLCNNMSNYRHLNISQHPCEKIRCVVIIRKSGGRLGNRMFIFASAYGLARAHGCRLHASKKIIKDLTDNFNISIKKDLWLSQEQVDKMGNFVIKYTICSFLPDMLKPNAFKHIELKGFWQSYLYFDAYRDEIREIYSARLQTLSRLAKYFLNIIRNTCPRCSIPSSTSTHDLRQFIRINYNITWIGIHIRRSDFRGLGYTSDENYIHRAILYYKRRFYNQQIRFLVASDDKTYSKKLFSNKQKYQQIFILPDSFSHIDDLITLSFCHHSILTGGTYGFWAGYLAGGEVIHDIMYKAGCTRSDYYPPWFKLVGEIKDNVR